MSEGDASAARSGRVAVVTGGASGIGRATAALLVARGVHVAVFDRNGDPSVDVSDADDVTAAVQRVRATLGPIDVVVNAAGVAAGAPVDDPDAYLDAWQRAIDVNLTGTMLVVRACVADLIASPAGRIVNIASSEGISAQRNTGPYVVSKHGVVGFTRSLAADLGRRGVTANCVCPGATLTGMTEVIPAEHRDRWAKRHIPAGRYGTPEEIAHMVVALTDEAASFVNGAVIPVDGGMTATTT